MATKLEFWLEGYSGTYLGDSLVKTFNDVLPG